jgi:hypothetical protein
MVLRLQDSGNPNWCVRSCSAKIVEVQQEILVVL